MSHNILLPYGKYLWPLVALETRLIRKYIIVRYWLEGFYVI